MTGWGSFPTTTPATSAGSSTWTTKRSWRPTTPRPEPARPGKDRRCARASSSAEPAAPGWAPATGPAARRATCASAAGTTFGCRAAADEVASRHTRIHRAAELAVARARYDADRAERAFTLVEPENRLVARTLEQRWETRLAALVQAEAALLTAQAAKP